jgi:hypothetical protein
VKRREFIALLGGTAAWPFAARAQQSGKVQRIGFLGTSSPSLERHLVDAFRQKLRDLGQVEGQNIAIEFRWAEGRQSRNEDHGGKRAKMFQASWGSHPCGAAQAISLSFAYASHPSHLWAAARVWAATY